MEPKRIRRVGNHFLALFPVTKKSTSGVGGGRGGLNQFRNHALLRGGSRIIGPPIAANVEEMTEGEEQVVLKKQKRATGKWDGGRGRWANDDNNEAEKQ